MLAIPMVVKFLVADAWKLSQKFRNLQQAKFPAVWLHFADSGHCRLLPKQSFHLSGRNYSCNSCESIVATIRPVIRFPSFLEDSTTRTCTSTMIFTYNGLTSPQPTYVCLITYDDEVILSDVSFYCSQSADNRAGTSRSGVAAGHAIMLCEYSFCLRWI